MSSATGVLIAVLLVNAIGATTQRAADPDAPMSGTAITSYELRIYGPGQDPSADPSFRRYSFSADIVRCNQDPVTEGAVAVNPTLVQWQDPDKVAKVCTAEVRTFLRALRADLGPYIATLIAFNQWGPSEPSAPSNIFVRLPGTP